MKTLALNSMFEKFFAQNTRPDHFYLTGFEGLCVEANHAQVCEAVISSVVNFDRELLILSNEASETCKLWRKICRELDIKLTFLDINDENILDAIETLLTANTKISHVLCSSEREGQTLKEIGKIVRQRRRSFIVDNCTDEISMANINEFNIDFLIMADEPMSMIIARRSKLVQTEGIARRASHDIYAIWQKSMNDRLSTLEPMMAMHL